MPDESILVVYDGSRFVVQHPESGLIVRQTQVPIKAISFASGMQAGLRSQKKRCALEIHLGESMDMKAFEEGKAMILGVAKPVASPRRNHKIVKRIGG